MTDSEDIFRQLQQAGDQGGTAAVLERLTSHLQQQGKYLELFEARKMQIRHRLGLPIDYQDAGELDEETGRRLEEALLGACREAGEALMAAGQVREGWMYLRPLGDRALVARLLRELQPEQENIEAMIEVAFHEGVDVPLGFRWVLEHFGTCHAVTILESSSQHITREDQRRAVDMLVTHLHAELEQNLRASLAKRPDTWSDHGTLAERIARVDGLFDDHAYHIDGSHLASTVRAARLLRDAAPLRLAADLTEYGRRLAPEFQFGGEEPFADFYPSHGLFFQASLGERVQEAVEFFRHKARTLDAGQSGTLAREVYIELLARLGRLEEAIDIAAQTLRDGLPCLGFAPTLFQLSKQAGDFRRLRAVCQANNDPLGYAIALVQP